MVFGRVVCASVVGATVAFVGGAVVVVVVTGILADVVVRAADEVVAGRSLTGSLVGDEVL